MEIYGNYFSEICVCVFKIEVHTKCPTVLTKSQEVEKKKINNDFRKRRLCYSTNFSYPNQRASKSKGGSQDTKEIDLA